MIIRRYSIDICDGCFNLQGAQCHTPGCALIRLKTAEIKDVLEETQLHIYIEGQLKFKDEDGVFVCADGAPDPRAT